MLKLPIEKRARPDRRAEGLELLLFDTQSPIDGRATVILDSDSAETPLRPKHPLRTIDNDCACE
jgi:hypothetical protein